eukprot:TRINITY_DN5266_c0_g1_i1.p1 TRINITY_DN5266_c0_g1~~TRINITY_DN5266_c0_g1_i1.p1  ORF type:complete len:660 (-),score=105.61 TRINITY_DN5266_c0_g1_i1:15-1994(-)
MFLVNSDFASTIKPQEQIQHVFLMIVVVVMKFLRVGALFFMLMMLWNDVSVLSMLWWVMLFSTVLFYGLHRQNVAGIKTKQWVLASGYSVLMIVNALFWLLSLKYAGPFRLTVFGDYSDFFLTALFSLMSEERKSDKIRSLLFFSVSFILQNFMGDSLNYEQLGITDAEEGTVLGMSYSFFGSACLIITIFISFVRKAVSKRLQPFFKNGNLKSARTLTLAGMICTVALLTPILLLSSFSSEWIGFSNIIGFLFISVFVVLGDYYIEGSGRLNIKSSTFVTITLSASALSSVILNFFLDYIMHGIIGFIDFFFLLIALNLLLWNFHKAGDMLPTYSDSQFSSLQAFIKIIWKNKDSRNIFIFLCVNLAFMFVELVYGMLTNSLGLISDAFHMLFDCLALAIGLYASVIKEWEANKVFSFGYGRVEVLSGFVNAIFLCFIALSVLNESIQRLINPPEINTDNLIIVSVLGFLVNLVGLYAFHDHSGHGHSHGGHGHSHGGHGHSHGDEEGQHNSDDHDDNLQGVFLHVLADTLGSVGVIISSILIHLFNWTISDPICSLFISVLIFLSVIPLLKNTSEVLLQKTPNKILRKYGNCVGEIRSIKGVTRVNEPHFWGFTAGTIVGSVVIHADSEAHEQNILRDAHAIFRSYGVSQMTIQIEK